MNDVIISKVEPEAFLIKDPSLKDIDAPFLCWLRENGFKLAWHKGHYDVCPWVFVNITHKIFAYGMPGIKIVQAIGDHAITIDEFFTIWNIYAKYKGFDLLAMDEAEQKDRIGGALAEKESCQYEEYIEAVRECFKEYGYSNEEITEYFNRPDISSIIKENYDSFIKHDEGGGYSPGAVAGCLDMMYE